MASFHILLCHFVGCSGNLSQIFGVFLATCPSLMYPLEIKVTYFPKHLTVNTKASLHSLRFTRIIADTFSFLNVRDTNFESFLVSLSLQEKL